MGDGPPATTDKGTPSSRQQAADVIIEKLRAQDIDASVDVHMRAFTGFFLSFLGPSFLRQLYLAYCDHPETIALVARKKGSNEILGVAIGCLKPGGFYKRLMLNRWWRFALAAAGAACRRPSIIPRLCRALLYRGDAPSDRLDRALYTSCAVSPDAQGMGVGKLLTLAILENAKEAGVPGVFLTTDADNNDPVNAFHRRMGFTVETEFTTPEGRRMFRYINDFDDQPK